MDIMRQYYRISEIVNDDPYNVAYLIQKYHHKRIYFSAILSDVENASIERLAKYQDTLDYIAGMGEEQIQAEASGMTFDSQESYMNYLKDLLELNNVVYVSYSKVKMKNKSIKPLRKYQQGELF